MATFTAFTTLSGQPQAARLGAALETLEPQPTGVGVFEIEDGSGLWEIGGYFTDMPDATALALLAAVFSARDFAISEVPDVDWVAKVRRELAPITAGRFFLYGSHDADKVPANMIGLRVDAAMAFGTGHHGTTKGCLEALDELASDGFSAQNVIDVGCGTAVLAMAAARLWPVPIIASDIDDVAVQTATANVSDNGLFGRIECVRSAGFDHQTIGERSPFDLVFANILKGPLIDLAQPIATRMSPGGYVILSGILNAQADEVSSAYCAAGFTPHSQRVLGEWTTLTLKMPHI